MTYEERYSVTVVHYNHSGASLYKPSAIDQ